MRREESNLVNVRLDKTIFSSPKLWRGHMISHEVTVLRELATLRDANHLINNEMRSHLSRVLADNVVTMMKDID
jgi:hypothetical protein